ncbi:MAG TPA: hypothetical protein VJ642_05380 [Chromobacteriaceae bacterium]|nr:hypothetical protein [Chromobacteriaceae bacterium]
MNSVGEENVIRPALLFIKAADTAFSGKTATMVTSDRASGNLQHADASYMVQIGQLSSTQQSAN